MRCGISLLSLSLALSLPAAEIILTNDVASCVVETRGARIMSFRPANGGEVFWKGCSAGTNDFEWVHGGVPICWPWFGYMGRRTLHGTAAWSDFRVVSQTSSLFRCELLLLHDDGKRRLELQIVLTDKLSLELRTMNCAENGFSFAEAFHPYFLVSDCDAVKGWVVRGREFDFRSSPDDFIVLDRQKPSVVMMFDPIMTRTIRLELENVGGINIWNPGPLADCQGGMPRDGWRHFVAIEPAACNDGDVITLPAGNVHRMKVTISVVGSNVSGTNDVVRMVR